MPSHVRAIARSTVGGICAVSSQFITLPLLVHVLGVAPAIAYFAVQFLATVITFSFNRWWAFQAGHVGLGGQGLRYIPVFAGSLGLNTAIPSLLHYRLEVQPVLAFAISQGVVFLGWNYPLYRFFVFRHRPMGGPADEQAGRGRK